MDLTLRQYSESCDKLHNALNIIDPTKISNILYELESYVMNLQSVAFKAAKLYNKYKRFLSNNSLFLPREEVFIDIKPSENDCSILERVVVNNSNTKVLAPNIHINTISVKSEDMIPNVNLYYLEDCEQFAIKINNILLKGHIGEIFTKTMRNITNVKKCDFSNCKNSKCKYYHEPDSSTLNSHETKSSQKPLTNIQPLRIPIKNFTNCNWLYTKELKTSKNIYMRHFGNRSTLSSDLDILKLDATRDSEIDQFKTTLFHDILVLIAINQKGLINCSNKNTISKRFKGIPILNILPSNDI